MGELRILSAEGDTKVIWDPDNEDEVEAAEAQFDILVKKGFRAYRVDKKGEKTTEIKKFNSSLGKIILVPIVEGG